MNNKTRNGNYIGKVDEGSVAFATGLRVGDRIVEVNGVNVEKEQHKQVHSLSPTQNSRQLVFLKNLFLSHVYVVSFWLYPTISETWLFSFLDSLLSSILSHL